MSEEKTPKIIVDPADLTGAQSRGPGLGPDSPLPIPSALPEEHTSLPEQQTTTPSSTTKESQSSISFFSAAWAALLALRRTHEINNMLKELSAKVKIDEPTAQSIIALIDQGVNPNHAVKGYTMFERAVRDRVPLPIIEKMLDLGATTTQRIKEYLSSRSAEGQPEANRIYDKKARALIDTHNNRPKYEATLLQKTKVFFWKLSSAHKLHQAITAAGIYGNESSKNHIAKLLKNSNTIDANNKSLGRTLLDRAISAKLPNEMVRQIICKSAETPIVTDDMIKSAKEVSSYVATEPQGEDSLVKVLESIQQDGQKPSFCPTK